MPIPCDDQGMTLFQASTIIKLGDGKKAKFWWDKWLDGETPKDIASHLFALVHFKQRTVSKELPNKNWIRAVRRLSSSDELHEFINLWGRVRDITLSQTDSDEILWKWSPNGEYMARSAYQIQFNGSHPPFHVGKL
jgi:hypothetical protein